MLLLLRNMLLPLLSMLLWLLWWWWWRSLLSTSWWCWLEMSCWRWPDEDPEEGWCRDMPEEAPWWWWALFGRWECGWCECGCWCGWWEDGGWSPLSFTNTSHMSSPPSELSPVKRILKLAHSLLKKIHQEFF